MHAITQQSEFPGLPSWKSYAAFPVWRDSARAAVKFYPLAKREAVRLFHHARRFERSTRQRGRQDGRIGRNGLAVLHALIFDCLNYRNGRCDPSYATIARLANISIRSVARGLVKLKAAGVLAWVRRCRESIVGGQWRLEQESNAYGLQGLGSWRGYSPPPPAPRPFPEAWGACPPIPAGLQAAAIAISEGANPRQIATALASDPSDSLALALANLRNATLT